MYIPDDKILLIFVSTGRCGTKRLQEILNRHLGARKVCVKHQVGVSRFANVMGHLMFFVGSVEKLKERLFAQAMKTCTESDHYISSDPLVSTVIPKTILERPNTHIVHLHRDHEAFAKSMYALTRNRRKSFVAHNLIPLWQPGLWPFENMIRRNRAVKKYKRISEKKNEWFRIKYSRYQNYHSVNMMEVFESGVLENIVMDAFGIRIKIDEIELQKKSNESRSEV